MKLKARIPPTLDALKQSRESWKARQHGRNPGLVLIAVAVDVVPVAVLSASEEPNVEDREDERVELICKRGREGKEKGQDDSR